MNEFTLKCSQYGIKVYKFIKNLNHSEIIRVAICMPRFQPVKRKDDYNDNHF